MENFIIVKAIKTIDNQLIPIWDNRLKYIKDDYFGNHIRFSDDNRKYFDLIDCVYGLKERKISLGIEVDIYPDKTNFAKEEDVYVEVSHHKLKEAKIVDIEYNDFDLHIKKGKKLEAYEKEYIENVQPDSIYAIKNWKPTYILDDGTKIDYDYKLYSKV